MKKKIKDFHEILTEAGRYKYQNKKGRTVRDIEDLPDRESMRPRGRGKLEFEFKDHLMPLFRWLCKQCGRPWNKVYSELTGVDFKGVAGVHIKSHLDSWVEKYPVMIGKKPHHPVDQWNRRAWPVNENHFWVDKNGILKRGFKEKKNSPKPDYFTISKDGKSYYITSDGKIFTHREYDPRLDLGSPKVIKYLTREERGQAWEFRTFKLSNPPATGDWDRFFSKNNNPHYLYGNSIISGPFQAVYEIP